MIRWIIVLLGVSAGSSLTEVNRSKASIKNDTRDSYLPQFDSSSSGFKPKRQLDDIEFDASTFDSSSSLFPIKKINGLTSFDDEDTSDFSAAISSPSFKVTRSSSDSLGTHNQNYDSSIKFNVKPQQGEQENYSNENQPNTALNSQVPTSFYKPVVQQSKYVETNNMFYNDPINIPFNSYPAMNEYAFSTPIYNLKQVPVHPIASGYQQNQASTQNIPYKTIFGQELKTLQPNSQVYAPLQRYNSQPKQQPFQAHFQNFAQNPYDIQYTTASTAEINNKKLSLPIVQLQSAQDGYIQELESIPVIFSAEGGLQYKNEPTLSIPFDFAKTKSSNQRSGFSAPFVNQPTLGPIQVLPLETASSTANFPQYKGATVTQISQKPFTKIPNDYQEFKTQTQLHFGGNANNNNKQEALRKPVNAKPLERIRTDVEVIDKKKPIPPLPKTDDDDEGNNEDESGEEYQSKDSYLPKNDDDDVDARKYFKESELEGDFKPSKSYPFKEYEEKYSKPLKKTSNDNEDAEENFDSDVDLAAKYRYLSKSEDDDDDENESAEDKPRSKYKSYPIEDSYKNYSDDDHDDVDDDDGADNKEEEESRKQERKEKSFDFEREHPSSRKGKPRKERRKSVEDEISEPIKKKQNKPKHSQHYSKGSNEFNNRPHSQANKRHEIPERNSKWDQRRRPYRDETAGEPLNHPSKSFRHFSSEIHFDEPSSSVSPFKITSTRSPSSTEDSFRLKKGNNDFHIDDGGQSTYSKEEAAVTDSYGNPRKSTSSAPVAHTARSPKTAGDQRTSRKSSGVKTKPILVDSYNKPVSSGLRALVQSKPSYFASNLNREDILRRLKGI